MAAGAGSGSDQVRAWFAAYPALREIEDPAWKTLLASARVMELPAGSTVFRDGDSCRNYFLVLEGSIRVQKVAESGREIVLYRVEPGDTCVLTTSCLLSSEHYPAEGITETAVRAVALPMNAFEDAVARSDAFRRFVFSVYARRISDLILLVQEVAFRRMDERLAHWLVQHADASREIATTHQDLAAELGTAREVVSRLLKDFERRGWLKLGRGHLEIADVTALQRASGRE